MSLPPSPEDALHRLFPSNVPKPPDFDNLVAFSRGRIEVDCFDDIRLSNGKAHADLDQENPGFLEQVIESLLD